MNTSAVVSNSKLQMRNLVFGCVAFLMIGTLFFPSAGWDDAYITYWAGHALADIGAIVNFSGDRVEQSSSLALVLIIAAVRRLTGFEAALVGKLVSITAGLGSVIGAGYLGHRLSRAGGAAAAVVATSSYFVYWSFGGMEASLAAAITVPLILLYIQYLDSGPTPGLLILATLLTLAYLLARPEALFILSATLVGFGIMVKARGLWDQESVSGWTAASWRRLVGLAAVIGLSFGAIVVFRYQYFGAFFPQPVTAKYRGFSRSGLVEGLGYLRNTASSDFVILLVLALVGCWMFLRPRAGSSKQTRTGMLCATLCLASLGFIVTSGGDGINGGRFFVPIIPVAAALGAACLSQLPSRLYRGALVLWLLAQIGGVFAFARTGSHSDPIWASSSGPEDPRFFWFERGNHDQHRYFPVVAALEQVLDSSKRPGRRVEIFSGQSGFVMYQLARRHFGELKYLDRFALVSTDFTVCPVSAKSTRSKWGLVLPELSYLKRIDVFQRTCGICPADIIYDLFWGDFSADLDRALTANGYRIIYRQQESFPSNSKLFPGRAVDGHAYIAVRNENGTEQCHG